MLGFIKEPAKINIKTAMVVFLNMTIN